MSRTIRLSILLLLEARSVGIPAEPDDRAHAWHAPTWHHPRPPLRPQREPSRRRRRHAARRRAAIRFLRW